MRTISPLVLLAFAALLTGCPDKTDTDTDVGTDTDSGTESTDRDTDPDTDGDTDPDTDGDTDADTDPDTDADTSVPVQALTGTSTITIATLGTDVSDAPVDESCAADFTITGTEFVGPCNDCDWAFEVTSTETANDCSGDIDPRFALAPIGDDAVQPLFAFWSTYAGYYASYTDVLATGTFETDAYGTFITSGLVINLIYGATNYGDGSFTLVDTALDWTTADEVDLSTDEYINGFCEGEANDVEVEAALAGAGTAGTLPCGGDEFDIYSFEAAIGTPVTMTVDTVADGTAFDSGLTIISTDTCELASADDSFDCAFAPTAFQCSGLTFDPIATGTHYVVVENFGSCIAEGDDATGDYTLVTDGSTLALLGDDVTNEPVNELTETTTWDVSIDFTEAP